MKFSAGTDEFNINFDRVTCMTWGKIKTYPHGLFSRTVAEKWRLLIEFDSGRDLHITCDSYGAEENCRNIFIEFTTYNGAKERFRS